MPKDAGPPDDSVVPDGDPAIKAPTFADAGLMASDTALIQEMTS